MHISKAVVSLALAASTASALPHCNDGQCTNGASGGGNGLALAQGATRSQTQAEQTDGKDGQMKVVRTHLQALASGNNQQTNGQQQGGLQQTYSSQQQQGEQQPGIRHSLDFKKDGGNRDGGLNTAEGMGGSQTTGPAGTRGGFENLNQDGNGNGGSNMPKPKLQSNRRSSSTLDNAPPAKMMDQVQNPNQQQQQQQQQYQQHLDQTDSSLIERFVKYLLSSGQTQQTQGNDEQNMMQWDASGQNGQQQTGGQLQQGNTIRAVLGGGESYPNNHGDGNGQYGKLVKEVVSGNEGGLPMHGNYQKDPPHWLDQGAIVKPRSYLPGVAQLDMNSNNNNNNNGNGMQGGQGFTTTVRVNDQGEEEEGGLEGQNGGKLQARQQTKGGQTINPYTGLPYWNGPLAFQKGDPSSSESTQIQREEGSQSNIPTIVITQHTARDSGNNQQEGGQGGFQNTASSSPYRAHGDFQNTASSSPYRAHGDFQNPDYSSPYHGKGDFQNAVVRAGGDTVPDIKDVPPALQKFTTSSAPTQGQQQNGDALLGGIRIRDARLSGAEEGIGKDGDRATKVVLQHLDAGQGQQQQQPQGEQKKGEDVEIGQVLAFCNELARAEGEGGQQGLKQGQQLDGGNLQMLLNCVKRVQNRFIVKA
ncbi:hypothetical protein QBC43DRAFT_293258 [Cladorrhinum sp. PSN259]|nr:hypothetical protein QBC43DRAFT_293258 [Cladorrhinum sp. PSN259]